MSLDFFDFTFILIPLVLFIVGTPLLLAASNDRQTPGHGVNPASRSGARRPSCRRTRCPEARRPHPRVSPALESRYTVLLFEPLPCEVLGVRGREFDRSKHELARVALFLDDLAERTSPRSRLDVLDDEPDNRTSELAVDCQADVIVTGRTGRYA